MAVSKRNQKRRPMLIKPLRELIIDQLQVSSNRMLVVTGDSVGFKTRTSWAEDYLLIDKANLMDMRWNSLDGPNLEPMEGVVLLKITLSGTTIKVDTVYSDKYDPIGWTLAWKVLSNGLRRGRKAGWCSSGVWLHKRKPTIAYIGEWGLNKGFINANYNESSRPF